MALTPALSHKWERESLRQHRGACSRRERGCLNFPDSHSFPLWGKAGMGAGALNISRWCRCIGLAPTPAHSHKCEGQSLPPADGRLFPLPFTGEG